MSVFREFEWLKDKGQRAVEQESFPLPYFTHDYGCFDPRMGSFPFFFFFLFFALQCLLVVEVKK